MASHHPRPTETMLVFDSMRIRTKLAVALIIPLVALVGPLRRWPSPPPTRRPTTPPPGPTRSTTRSTWPPPRSARPVSSPPSRTSVSGEAVDLIGVADIALLPGQTPENLRAADDVAIAQFKAAIASRSAAVQEAYQPAIDAMNTIPDHPGRVGRVLRSPHPRRCRRPLVGDRSTSTPTIARRGVRRQLQVALVIDDADLRAGATYIDQFSRYQEANTLLLAKIANAATKPGGVTGDLEAFGLASGTTARPSPSRATWPAAREPFYRDLTASTFANPDLAASDDVDRDRPQRPHDRHRLAHRRRAEPGRPRLHRGRGGRRRPPAGRRRPR